MIPELKNEKVILQPLSLNDAVWFYNIYDQPDFWQDGVNTVFLKDESPTQFTERILSLCECIFIIHSVHNNKSAIGDCALHHWDKKSGTIEIGGTLLKPHRGKGYMQAAFALLFSFAADQYNVNSIIGKTEVNNKSATSLALKMEFIRTGITDQTVILKKTIKPDR